MITRKEYISGPSGREAYENYYVQFVTDEITSLVVDRIGADKIRASTSYHFNDIPLAQWDNLSWQMPASLTEAMKAHGDFRTLAGDVCVAKMAARLWLRSQA